MSKPDETPGGRPGFDGGKEANDRRRRHHHLFNNKPKGIVAVHLLLVAIALSILAVLPLAVAHPRSTSTGSAPGNTVQGATHEPASDDGSANRTASASLAAGRSVPRAHHPRHRQLPVRRLHSNGSVSKISPPDVGHRRKIRPVRVYHHETGATVRDGRTTAGFLDDQFAGASNHRHHSKSMLRGPPAKPQYRVYENVQRGSITLPFGSEAFLAPDDNRTLAFSSQSDPTIYRPRAGPQVRRRNGRPQQGHGHRVKGAGALAGGASRRHNGGPTQPRFTVIDGLCISCPPEKTAIAREGLDGVLIEPPVLATCTGRPISKDLYELETLFGPKFNFVLPHSNGAPYSFLAKVVSKHSGNTVLTCDLRYRVVVKQCRRYKPKNRDLKVSCSLNSIWGSRCTFHCRSGGYLSLPNAVVKCGVNEIWEGEEPHCTFNDVSDDYAADIDPNNRSTTDCQLDLPPAHGTFACDLKESESASNELTIPNGTACQVRCNEDHYIPTHLHPAAYFGCVDGRWNNTMRHFCYKTTQIPGGIVQRHRGYG